MGVGPGDPRLLTVAAVEAIRAAIVVAYPVARLGASGMAAAIAAPWITPQQVQLPLLFPMVSEAAPLRQAWHAAADTLAAAVLEAAGQGGSVVLLCEGDVSLFASSSYVLLALRQRHPALPVQLIPGVSAVAAAAAAGAWPLALQQESLLIRPTPETPEALEALLDRAAAGAEVLALLKLGHRWAWVRPLLEQRGLLDQALFAQRVGWPDQQVASARVVEAGAAPYFSLLLIRQSWPEVLP
nr:precorrin-2 C(20)-methyltransferase [Synechococcus sp. CS-1328]